MSKAKGFFRQAYDLIAQIPRGRVATYGQIAAFLGDPRAARTVGWALHSLPPEGDIPWHRVINSQGRISLTYHPEEQRARLEEEGMRFNEKDQIDLSTYGWEGPEEEHLWRR
jgi:methylated-DNA-protein-cysteine methyltransferase-like protein